MRFGFLIAGVVLTSAVVCCTAEPTPREMIESQTDIAGRAALNQPGGPSYEYFAKLLPPLRYVDADFKCYPIVLSAPGGSIKGRVVSDGGIINALAGLPIWRNETGVPVRVSVGAKREAFGADLARLTGPALRAGYLPVVHLEYRVDSQVYGEEIFASVDEKYPGAILARFDFPGDQQGLIDLRFDSGPDYLSNQKGCIRDGAGRVIAVFDKNCWEFNKARSAILSKVNHPASATVMIVTPWIRVNSTPGTATQPAAIAEEHLGNIATGTQKTTSGTAITEIPVVNEAFYATQRQQAIERWDKLVANGTQITVPELVVKNAWRALIVQQYEILDGDHLNYSASNQYARQYSNECGDSMRSLLLYGHTDTASKAIAPLFIYRRPGIELHDGAFKLELLADYYFATRDAKLIRNLRPLWQREIDLILKSRQNSSSAQQFPGLLPRERYCSDIATPVISLNTNANCWRGLRDMAVVLEEIGERDQASTLQANCADYRKDILAAMDKAIVRSVNPPFVPVALSGEEPPPRPITSTRLGSYWNLVVPCVLWSGIFPIDSEPASDIIHYIEQNGGLCMGMTRVQSQRAAWPDVQNIDDLYDLRYVLALLKRDEPDKALVSFYGKLAQGFTRDTFYDGESSSIEPTDRFGRQFALPPNSTANASFLLQLRNLLVQDWDINDDGQPDTLRLLFATPRRWMEDGKEINVSNAPTAFGPVSVHVKSNLESKTIDADISLPQRSKPKRTLIRFRVPEGWKVESAVIDGKTLPTAASETFDLSGFDGKIAIHVNVARSSKD